MQAGEFWRLKNNTKIKIGLKWDLTIEEKTGVDLDASVVMVDELGEMNDAVYYN